MPDGNAGSAQRGMSLNESQRLAIRICTQGFLRQCEIVGDMFEGDLHKGLVFSAIVAANTQHIHHHSELARRHAGLDEAPTDGARRPVSTHALALSLGMPYETTRRYVNKLIDEGRCVRVPGQGLIVPTAYLTAEQNVANITQSLNALQWTLAALRRAGFDLNAIAEGVTPPPRFTL